MRARFLSVLLGLLLIPVLAQAENSSTVRKQAEASLAVNGSIEISAAGDVLDYSIDQPDKLPAAIVALIERHVPGWKFEPVSLPEGATRSRSNMRLLFVAKRAENGDYIAAFDDASFWADASAQEQVAVQKRRKMPLYPKRLVGQKVSGTVYVVLKVGRDGKVMDIDASHVNLRTIGPAHAMEAWRENLARSSIDAIKHWTFTVPASGEIANDQHWFGVIPVSFDVGSKPNPVYGKWEAYIPGPRKAIPWRDPSLVAGDALIPNSFHQAGQGPRLRTPLAGG
jgi:hypothetical protein